MKFLAELDIASMQDIAKSLDRRPVRAGLATVGAALAVLSTWLPLWSNGGVAVTGWDGNHLAVGRWLMVALLVIVGLAAWLVQRRGWWRLWLLMGVLALGEAGLVWWQGHKLAAVGAGTWLMLFGTALVCWAAVWQSYAESNGKD